MTKWPREKATDTQRSVNHITTTLNFLHSSKVEPREDQGLEKGFLSLILTESINQNIFLMVSVTVY